MNILLILILLAFSFVAYWLIGVLKNFLKSFRTEIEEELKIQGRILIEFREANDKDWENSPFPYFSGPTPSITINGMPVNQSFYRIIKYKQNENLCNAWVQVNTSPFTKTEIIIKNV